MSDTTYECGCTVEGYGPKCCEAHGAPYASRPEKPKEEKKSSSKKK